MSTSLINDSETDKIFGEKFQSESLLNYEVGAIIKHHATGIPYLLFLGIAQLKSEKCNLTISVSYERLLQPF